MTDIEKVLEELLKPHGFKKDRLHIVNNHRNRSIHIIREQVKLCQWGIDWKSTTIDLCDPNSLQIIEDWAKS